MAKEPEMVPAGPKSFFTEEAAAVYDERFARLAPLRDAMHLATRLVFSELPEQAQILCVGAGTGAETLMLGEAYPRWKFTLVEPSAAMLRVARKRCEAAGMVSRCLFHEGYLDTLAPGPEFDGATAILVSQFLTDPAQRQHFFRGIAQRLTPGGLFVSADLSGDVESKEKVLQIWLKLMEYNGSDPEQLQAYLQAYNRDFACSDTDEVESLISRAGFEPPVRFLQAVLIQAWFTRRDKAREKGSLDSAAPLGYSL